MAICGNLRYSNMKMLRNIRDRHPRCRNEELKPCGRPNSCEIVHTAHACLHAKVMYARMGKITPFPRPNHTFMDLYKLSINSTFCNKSTKKCYFKLGKN